MIDILQEILIFSDATKVRNAGIANGTDSNELNFFSLIRGIVEQGLRNLFITSSSSRSSVKSTSSSISLTPLLCPEFISVKQFS